MKKALITGITGFVGYHLAELLIQQDIEVYGLSRWRSPTNLLIPIMDKIKMFHGDLLDAHSIDSCLLSIKPDFIFHLAAQSYVPYSFDAPVSTLDTNCIGTCNLLESIKKLKLASSYDPIVHICSSSEVYGQVREDEVPITEDTPLRPSSPYAVSKVCEDMLGLQYWLSFGIKTIRTRMFTHTGPGRGEVFVVSNFAKQISEIERHDRDNTVLVGNLDSVRTFADVRDAVRAYWLLVTKCPPGEVYNIGGDVTMTVGEMLEMLISFSSKDIVIKQDPSRMRPSDVTLQIPSSEKFRQATGWKPEIPFEKTLEDTLNYWRCLV
jgi:GDP-mannose 4,6-dehydratase